MEVQHSWQYKAKRFFKETMRVLHVTKKPGKDEFVTLTKVTGIGCAIIGIIGFIIFMLKQLLL